MPATLFATFESVEQSTKLKADPTCVISTTFTLLQNLKPETALQMVFPTDFTLVPGSFHSLTTGLYQYGTSITFNVTAPDNFVVVTVHEYIAKDTEIVFNLQVTLPSVVANNYAFQCGFYRNNSCIQLYQDYTVSPLEVIGMWKMRGAVLPLLTPKTLL